VITVCRYIFLFLLIFALSIGMGSAANITTDLDYPQYWVKDAVGQYSLGHFDRALTLLDNAVYQDPTLASAWMWRSKALMELGRTKEAQESMAKAKELDPLIDNPYLKKVGSLANLKVTPVPTARPTESEDELKKMIQSDVNLTNSPDPTGPDMVMYDLQAVVNPQTQQVEITAVIGNEGVKPTSNFFISFYGSYSTPVSSSDSPIGFYLVDNLLPGTKKTIVGYFPIAEIPSGDYYIGGYIDPNGQIREISKDNNGKTAPAKVSIPEVSTNSGTQRGSIQLAVPSTPRVENISTKRPDLIIDAITGPTSAMLGEEILINTTVRNAGNADAGKFRVSVYLSKDAKVSDDDVELGFGDVPDLAAGKSRQGTAVATIPLNVAAGSYYLVGLADSQTKITEKDKTNNAGSMDATIIITKPSLPGDESSSVPTPVPSQTASPAIATPKVTSAPTGSPVLTVLPTPTQKPVTALTTPVKTQASVVPVESTPVPSGVSSSGLPNLVVDAITGPETAIPGEKILINTTVRNSGTADAGKFRLSVYLSKDATVSDDDIELGYGDIADLAAGKGREGTAVASIPQNITSGSYYLVAFADSQSDITENDKLNNIKSIDVPFVITATPVTTENVAESTVTSTPTPTLVPTTVAPTPTPTPEPVVTSTPTSTPTPVQVAATPTPTSTPTPVQVTATQTPTSTPTPVQVTATPTPTSTPVPTKIPTPVPTTAVSKSVSVTAAPTAVATPVQAAVTKPATSTSSSLLPDLVVKVRSSGTSGTPGGTFKATTTLTNNGKGNAGAFDVSLYLSTDKVINAQDSFLVGKGRIDGLASGKDMVSDTEVPIPESLKPGSYYFGILADSSNEITDANRDNNLAFGKSPVVIK
jgi:subtilase family serine protease